MRLLNMRREKFCQNPHKHQFSGQIERESPIEPSRSKCNKVYYKASIWEPKRKPNDEIEIKLKHLVKAQNIMHYV